MKPPPFSYHDPRTAADVVSLLGSLANAKLLAGGQTLMPMLNMRFVQPDHIVDLNRVDELSYIREREDTIEIGAMTRQRDIEFSDLVRRRCPLIYEAIRQVGHRQTRNRGTLGGSLCHLDPSAELVSCAAALDAKVAVAGRDGARSIEFSAFPLAYLTPALEPDELLTGVAFPCWPAGHGYAFLEFARRHGDFAIVSAAALLEEDRNGKVTRASLTLGGMGPAPIRGERGRAGAGRRDDRGKARRRNLRDSMRHIEAIDDIHTPASYRQQLATVLGRRALIKAHERIVEGIKNVTETRKIVVAVNGTRYEETVPVRVTLADFLRHQLGLTGTHLGCEHGVCGACTILLDGRSARSCLLLAVQADGQDLDRRRHRARCPRRCIRCRKRFVTIMACNAAFAPRAC